jgi:hypothetical protein
MTSKIHRSGPGDEDARLEELLRADAAAVADDDLFDDDIAFDATAAAGGAAALAGLLHSRTS